MIRTAAGGLTTKFFNTAFLEYMSHFCDIEAIPPCAGNGEVYIVSEDALAAVTDSFIKKVMRGEMHLFTNVGRMPFVKKKFVQLIAIAKSEDEIQLDLVSELIVWLIASISSHIRWKDDNNHCHSPCSLGYRVDFPEKEALIKSYVDQRVYVAKDDPQYDAAVDELTKEFSEHFRNFVTLMKADSEEIIGIFWDIHFSFLHDTDVVEGVRRLYTVADYDRKWHIRPWVEIGEPVPAAILFVLDEIDFVAARYGGIDEMREYFTRAYLENIFAHIM